MATPFGDYLDQLLADKGWSLRQFAQTAKITHTALVFFRTGKRPVPLARVEGWADLLQLTGRNRDRLLDLAELTHVPLRTRQLLIAIERAADKPLRDLLRDLK